MTRIASSLKRQDWVTVFIELVLVVVGILIALQLDQLNEDRKDRAREISFLELVRDDINRDIADLEGIAQSLDEIRDYGDTALTALEADDCVEECWTELVALFHASQWLDVRLNSSTYDEIKRTGLPRDPSLKELLTRYYDLGEQRSVVIADLPSYREIVRSIIPVDVQDYLWANCFGISGRQQTFIADCESPISNESARQIIGELKSSGDTKKTLRFWLSTVSVTKTTLPAQTKEARQVISVLTDYIDGAR